MSDFSFSFTCIDSEYTDLKCILQVFDNNATSTIGRCLRLRTFIENKHAVHYKFDCTRSLYRAGHYKGKGPIDTIIFLNSAIQMFSRS